MTWPSKFFRKPPPAKRGEINYPLLDRFTFVHFGIGIFYGLLGFSFYVAIGLALAWEYLENPLKANFPVMFPHATADTLQNMTGDVVALMAGWALAHFLLRHQALAQHVLVYLK